MKYTHSRFLTVAAAIGLGAALFLGIPQAKALTISPPSLEFGVLPGQRADLEVKFYNEDASQPVEVTTETTSWTAGKNPGEPNFLDEAQADDIAKWIKIGKGPFKLEPQGRMTVPVSVDVPTDAVSGGHYGAILFTFKNPNVKQDGQIAITPKIATLLLVRVDGPDVVESGAISAFGTTGGTTWYSHLPVSFTTTVQNTGTIHLKPKGAITITNSFGKQVASIDFNTEKGATLPKTTRPYTNEVWQVGTVQPVDGNVWHQFWTAFSNEKHNFAIGKFTAKADLTAGTLKPFGLSGATTFWVLPWHILVVYGVIVIVVIILLAYLIRKYNHWIRHRAENQPSDTKPKA